MKKIKLVSNKEKPKQKKTILSDDLSLKWIIVCII